VLITENNGFFAEILAIYAAGVVTFLAVIGQVCLSVGSRFGYFVFYPQTTTALWN